MTVYLASPNTQQQAEHVCGMPVLVSFAIYPPWLDRYQQTFSRILVDSGAFSEHTGAAPRADVSAYSDWAARWRGHADAVAGLDDISGDWRRSLKNYEAMPGAFPTFHNTDPPELLADLVAMALERDRWLGIGIAPPREGKESFVRWVCDRVPDGIHVHGWALRRYSKVRRIDSFDSTNWWRDAMKLRIVRGLDHLTYGECLEIVVKRYQREERVIVDAPASGLFAVESTAEEIA
jgi:hypothetical protein